MLRGKGYNQLLPMYRGRHRHAGRFRDVDLPLFPNYVFCQFVAEKRLPILMTPGVLFVVGSKGPDVVDESEINALQKLAGSGLPAQPWPFLQAGDRVRLMEGPLRHTEGIIVSEKGRWRLVLSITLLQRSVAVEVDRRWVKPISSAHTPNGRVIRSAARFSQTAVPNDETCAYLP
jgi:transcription antitermination factor NusG